MLVWCCLPQAWRPGWTCVEVALKPTTLTGGPGLGEDAHHFVEHVWLQAFFLNLKLVY